MKILMVCMNLNIGGAETHLIELCKSLSLCKDIKIFVASSGGTYEKELKKINIKHFKVPVNNKKIFNIIKSIIIIKKIIVEKKINIVHAHARIPAFVCFVIKKIFNINFKFITTAHGTFDTKSIYSKLSNWGEKTFAVSEDIKEYLIKNYFLKPENIKVTINGINTQKFIEEKNYENNFINNFDIDFKFNKNKKYIVHISRLNKDTSLACHEIINLSRDIYNLDKNFEILIIGDGDDYDNLKTKSNNINKQLGFKFINMFGAQTDIKKFLLIAFIFIGVSRAALEAMSCSRVVILFGNEGYLGIFNKNIFDIAYKTNFCCRKNLYDKTKFLKDIKSIVSLENYELDYIKKYNREIIEKYYSSNLMSQHALEIYNNILSDDKNKKIDVMISGYYGFNNSGDDYMLESIIKNLKEKDKNINILVLSKKPKETKKRYGVECINRFNLFLIDNLLNKTKMLVSGGGSLIQDVTSTHSLIYYLYIINLALKKNIKTMLLANGIGPIEKLKNKIKVFKILNKVDIITLRDSESIKELEEIGIYKPKVFLTSDITFSRNDDLDFSKIFDFKEKKYFVACIRDWKLKKINIFIKNIIKFCDYVYINYGLIPVFIVMHTQKDLKIIKKINNQLKVKSLIFKEQDYKKISNLIFNSEFVLSMRFHSIIYAIKNLKPFIAISYDPKIKSILREINMTELSIDINKMDFYNLIKILEKIKDNKLEIVNKLKTNLEVLKSRSVNNIDILFYHLRSNK